VAIGGYNRHIFWARFTFAAGLLHQVIPIKIVLPWATYFLPTMQKVSKKIAAAGRVATPLSGLSLRGNEVTAAVAMTFWSERRYLLSPFYMNCPCSYRSDYLLTLQAYATMSPSGLPRPLGPRKDILEWQEVLPATVLFRTN